MTTVSEISTIQRSGTPQIDALLSLAGGWNYLLPERTTLYYTFSLGAIAGEAPSPVAAFNASQKAAAAAILSYVSSVTGITFAETAGASSADIHFAACNLVGATTAGLCRTESSYSYFDDEVVDYTLDAYVFLDNVEHTAINTTLTSGGAGYEVLLHEIGHALGLGHPFNDPGPEDDAYILPANQDNTNNTVMSYDHAGGYKSTFQAYDLMALDWLYGDDGLRGSSGLNSTPTAGNNRPPVALDDTFTGKEDVVLSGNVRTNDTDPDGQVLTVAVKAGPKHGTLVLQPNGRFAYTPSENYSGADSFTYTLSDGSLTSTATVSIVLQPVNDAPVAADIQIKVAPNMTKVGQLPAATDLEGDPVTYVKTLNPQHGTVTVVEDGRYIYVPHAGYVGEDSFGFRITDSNGGFSLYTAKLTIGDTQEVVLGTPGNDHLVDVSGDALLQGLAGNDTLQGGSGDDRIEGGDGLDTAVYVGPRGHYMLTSTAEGLRVTDTTKADGVDLLVGVERLVFADRKVAFDLSDNAGEAARMLGAALGPDALQNRALVGIALAYFDAGATLVQSAEMLVDTGLLASFAGGSDNRTIAEFIWHNVTGNVASPETSQALQDILGVWSQARLLQVAMELPQNSERVDLVGLAQTGLAYV